MKKPLKNLKKDFSDDRAALLTLAESAVMLLGQHEVTVGFVESATGGLVSELITAVPGSSEYFLGALVTYADEVKNRVAGVSTTSLNKKGAVSAVVAQEMAAGGLERLGVDICVSDTGIAGPGGATLKKPVGLFYLALADGAGVGSRRLVFDGRRHEIRMQAARAVLEWLVDYLENLPERRG
ncbi:CinA family protein [Chloroflexota bacterium]